MEIGRVPGSKAVQVPLLVIAPLLVIYVVALELSRETIDIVVEDKNMVATAGAAGDPPTDRWLIYTAGETFSVGGDWTRGELYAGKRYGELKPGRAYRVRVAGWRIPLLDWYRTIVGIENGG